MSYPSVFHLAADAFREAGASAILVEGYAVNYYGYARQTADVDFLIDEEYLPTIKTVLEKKGCREITAQKMFSRFRQGEGDLMDLDLLLSDAKTMAKMLSAGKKTEIYGQAFTVPDLLHLLAMKVHAVKNDPGFAERTDMQDIIHLIRINDIDARNKDFKETCLKFGDEAIYNRITDAIGKK